MEAIPFANLAKLHQYSTIVAGANGRVFYLKIPDSCVGFLKLIGNNWFSNTYYEFYIDGELIESKVEREIGDPNDPTEFNPPYVVKNYIEFKAYNNSANSEIFEVVCDGIAIHKQK